MTELLPALMFLAFTLLILASYPIAFTIGGTALGFGLAAFGFGFFDLLPLRIWGLMTNFTLITVPLFIFMGATLERSGLAQYLLETMGLISLPTMLHRGYHREVAAGVICRPAHWGSPPPSIVLVLVGDILGVSVGDLFLAALIPGMSLAGMYLLYLLYLSLLFPHKMPPIPLKERAAIGSRALGLKLLTSLPPVLILMIVVLGSIFLGIAAPTEAAAVSASGTVLLTILKHRFNLKMLREVMKSTPGSPVWFSSSWWARRPSV